MQNNTASFFHFFSDFEDKRLISCIGFEGIQTPSVHYMVSSSVEFNIKFCRGGHIFLSPILLFGVSNRRETNLSHMYEREPHKNIDQK